ncbi:2680_t:CDS:2 [Acaulospora colombiana]|uniref:2680_t:CDS:1 n=1 Tax=Acaulospora colombiana TaxID=27376 RepID=A0ACA9MGR0_9GLOM|nr:2680_t:CDS:2 [Acaulospora colombiana]
MERGVKEARLLFGAKTGYIEPIQTNHWIIGNNETDVVGTGAHIIAIVGGADARDLWDRQNILLDTKRKLGRGQEEDRLIDCRAWTALGRPAYHAKLLDAIADAPATKLSAPFPSFSYRHVRVRSSMAGMCGSTVKLRYDAVNGHSRGVDRRDSLDPVALAIIIVGGAICSHLPELALRSLEIATENIQLVPSSQRRRLRTSVSNGLHAFP